MDNYYPIWIVLQKLDCQHLWRKFFIPKGEIMANALMFKGNIKDGKRNVLYGLNFVDSTAVCAGKMRRIVRHKVLLRIFVGIILLLMMALFLTQIWVGILGYLGYDYEDITLPLQYQRGL